MKVILTKDVNELGKAGQVVNVAEGHARNFLIPRKMAVIADEGALGNLEKKRKILEVKGEQLLAEAQKIAEKINELKVIIEGKAGSGSKLYGAVTSQEIADALLKQHKISVDKRKIQMADPIKSIGTYEVPIKLHHEVLANIHVEVVGKE